MSNNLSNLFGLSELKEEMPVAKIDPNANLENDTDEIKANLKALLETGNQALEQLLNLAVDTEDSKVYDVLTHLIDTLGSLNHKVIDVYNKKADIRKKSALSEKDSGASPTVNGDVTNNSIVFNGTTAELSKFLSELNNNKGDIQDAIPKSN